MIAIKDFGVPGCCMNCEMFRVLDGEVAPKCVITGHIISSSDEYLDKRADDCPLIEIQERKLGEWLLPDKYYDKNIWRKCSVCNKHFEKYYKYVSFSGEVTYTEVVANYCKACGAEMKENNNG